MSARRGCLSKEGLLPHDLAEVERFERMVGLVGEKQKAGESFEDAQRHAYADIYGEVIFDAAAAPGQTKGPR